MQFSSRQGSAHLRPRGRRAEADWRRSQRSGNRICAGGKDSGRTLPSRCGQLLHAPSCKWGGWPACDRCGRRLRASKEWSWSERRLFERHQISAPRIRQSVQPRGSRSCCKGRCRLPRRTQAAISWLQQPCLDVTDVFRLLPGTGWLAKHADLLSRVERRSGSGSEIQIFTPEELRKLLAAAPARVAILVAIQAFAGVRTAELFRLMWHDSAAPAFLKQRCVVLRPPRACCPIRGVGG